MTGICFSPDGTAVGVYNEVVPPKALGRATITRASHVEPTADGDWSADLTPVGGPVLGPFPSRSAALDAEIQWLNRHLHQLARATPAPDSSAR